MAKPKTATSNFRTQLQAEVVSDLERRRKQISKPVFVLRISRTGVISPLAQEPGHKKAGSKTSGSLFFAKVATKGSSKAGQRTFAKAAALSAIQKGGSLKGGLRRKAK